MIHNPQRPDINLLIILVAIKQLRSHLGVGAKCSVEYLFLAGKPEVSEPTLAIVEKYIL